MASRVSSSSSSFSYAWKHDVFLNFRGKDTRHGFTGNLYNALVHRGIHTFLDDNELQKGEEISQALVKEIQESRIFIPVFSENYASSSFCLDELSTIIEFVNSKGPLVLPVPLVVPVFYYVDPSDVRHQRGSYEDALAKHEERFKDDKDKVQKWRMALHQAANLSGWHFKHGNVYEYVFIENITKVISNKINRKPLHVADYPVGLESQVHKVKYLLGDRSDDRVHMVGIYGIGGIGKTTLARALYNLIADQFEGLCFLENVRENSTSHGLVYLQETLLSEIFGEDIKLRSADRGIPIIKHRLQGKKVLLILDDVDKRDQLRAVVGGIDWFGSGSRIIITTREKHLLASHGVEITYEMDGLSKEEARELFCWNAFKKRLVDPDYVDTIDRAVTYTCGLPLALEVIGSDLFGRSTEEWISALDQYERIPKREIQKILQVSFDALEEQEQQIFLDIACFFKGFKLAEVEDRLCAHHGGCQRFVIAVLLGKSLIKINDYGEVTLHDLIEDMGREIVRQEGKPGERSRLWHHEDIIEVLEGNDATCKIQIIFLDPSKSKEAEVEWDGEAFKDMKSLKTLVIRNVRFSQGPKHLPNSLRVLEWQGYPSESLPLDFYPKKLVILKLVESCFMSHMPLQKKFVKLRVLNFDYCKEIKQIPNVSGATNLEELSFRRCVNLTQIDESVGLLNKLKILCAEGCAKLRSFPPIKLISLEELHLSFCESLEYFPKILAKLEKIRRLTLARTATTELPDSIQNISHLGYLKLNVGGMVQSPSDKRIARFTNLEIDLDFGSKYNKSFCISQRISDESLPIFLGRFANMEQLYLSERNFTILPACITKFLFLRELDLVNCYYLREIRGIPPKLETLSVTRCTSLKVLDLTVIHAGTKACSFLRKLILDHRMNVEEIGGIPPHIEVLIAPNCTSLTHTWRNMLLDQKLHEEAGNRQLFFPGSRVPKWFEDRSIGSSISFWFDSTFPAISVCFVIRMSNDTSVPFRFCPKLKINGITADKWLLDKQWECVHTLAVDHILIFNVKQINLEDNVGDHVHKVFRAGDHVEVSLDVYSTQGSLLFARETGLHVFKTDVEYIQPTYPKEEMTKEQDFKLLEMRKVVLKVELYDDKIKTKAMKAVICIPGVESISVNMKDLKLTLIGDVDPIHVVAKLRKLCHAEILSVGPVKEEEKEEKKEKKTDEKKKDPKEELGDL